jgi:D-alanyl-D-alanine dipeptidase/carboxypeptidase
MIEITLHKEDVHKGNLILINKLYPIKFLNQPSTLIPVYIDYPEILMDMKAASVLLHLLKHLNCTNDILPVSGFRTKLQQENIYSSSLAANGQAFTEQYVALPNHSEHQTGLAIDLAKKQTEIDFIRPDFPYEGIYQRFRDKASDYGFIERYQCGKEHITGIAHEPWHFRYVGYPHSKIMATQGFSLEEYIEFLKGYPVMGKHLHTSHKDQMIEIFYIDLTGSSPVNINLPKGALYQISGNNTDGIIVTLWR